MLSLLTRQRLSTKTAFKSLCRTPSQRGLSSKVTRALPFGDSTLEESDPEVHALLKKEWDRQYRGIELIASENFAYTPVM